MRLRSSFGDGGRGGARLVCAPLLLLALCLSVAPRCDAAIWVGGSGSGLYFSRERCDVLGLTWSKTGQAPTDSFTIEAWLQIVDTLNKDHTVLAYSEFNGAVSPPYNNPDGIQLRVSGSGTKIYRGVDQTCSAAACKMVGKGWFHYASTWDSATGTIKQYFNGRLENSATRPGDGQFGLSLTRDGSMLLGQEPDGFAGLFDENQAFDGLIDELRVWTRVRSAGEIAQSASHTLLDQTPAALRADQLALYYSFDNTAEVKSDAGIVRDETDSGNTGLLGHLVNALQWCTYASGTRAARMPQRPRSVVTSTGLALAGNQPLHHFVAPAVSASSTLHLRAHSDTGGNITYTLVSLPSTGRLSLASQGAGGPALAAGDVFAEDTLLFTYTSAQQSFPPLAAVDSFSYSASDGASSGSSSVLIRSHATLTPQNLSYTTNVDRPLVVNMGALFEDGVSAEVVLSTLPEVLGGSATAASASGAAVYQVSFGTVAAGAARYADIVTTVAGRAAMARGEVVAHERGVVLFGPPAIPGAVPRAVSVRFGFRLRHPLSLEVSSEAFVTVRVVPVNRAPVVAPASAPLLKLDVDAAPRTSTGAAGQPYGVVQLGASDADSSFSGQVLQRVTSLPRLGSLYQVDPATGALAGGSGPAFPDSALTVSSRLSVPTVSSWATRVMNSSSQYNGNGCAASCAQFLSCDWSACKGTSFTSQKILGPNDCYPATGDCAGNAEPSTKNDGRLEWIEVEFGATPIYVSAVEVFETMTTGMVVRIAIAAEWVGSDQTEWVTIYSGEADTFLSGEARIFSPSVCTLASLAARFVRVEFRTDIFVGAWTGLDAVRVSGSLVPPPGRLTDPTNRVAYVPYPGIFSANATAAAEPFDSFTYRPNDCVTEGAETTVLVHVVSSAAAAAAPSSPGAHPPPATLAALRAAEPFSSAQVAVEVGEDATVAVDVAAVLAAYNAAFPATPATSADVVVTLADIQALPVADQNADAGVAVAATELPQLSVHQLGSAGLLLCSSLQSSCPSTTLSDASHRFLVRGSRSSKATTDASRATYALSTYATVRGYTFLVKTTLVLTQQKTFATWSASDNSAYTVGVTVLSAVVLAYVAALSVGVYLCREHAVFRAASPVFCGAILAGAGLACLYCIIAAQYAPSGASCLAEIWLGHMAYALAFGVLFAKTWRVNRIFNQSKIQVVRLTNTDLGLRVGAGLAVVAIYLTVWSAVRAPEPTPTLLGNTVYLVCSSRNDGWPNALLALEGAVLLWGVLLCIQQRSYPDLFNDSQSVAVSLYNTAVLGALAIGVSKSALLSSGPTIALFQQVAVLLCVLVLVSVLFVSKFLIVRSGLAGGFGAKVDNRTYQGSVLDSKDGSSSPAATAANKHSHGATTTATAGTAAGGGNTNLTGTGGGHALRSVLSNGPSSVQMSAQRYVYTQGQGQGQQGGGTAASSRLSPMPSGASPPPVGAGGASPGASGAHLSVEGGHSARVAPMLPPPALAAFSPNQLAVHRLSTGTSGANANANANAQTHSTGRLRAGSSAVSPRSSPGASHSPIAPPGGSPTSGGGGGGDQTGSSAHGGQSQPSPNGSPSSSDGAGAAALVGGEPRLSPAVLSQNWAQGHDGGGGGALPNVVLSDSSAESDVSQ